MPLGGAGGKTRFKQLNDTPDTYSGQAGKYAKVNDAEDALEFGSPAGSGDFLADGTVPMTGDFDAGGNAVTNVGNVDGRDVSADGTKLDGIESGATADQTGAEIKAAYEAEADTNAFTDADHSKLDAIEAAADVTDAGNVGSSIHGADAKTTPVDADTVPLIDSAASNVLKKVTWANVKATLKTYFDTLYAKLTMVENEAIKLVTGLSADGKYSGFTVGGTSGYAQAFGDLVYLDPTDSRWEKCDANAASAADGDSRGTVGMVVSAGTDGNACTILLQGTVRADAKFPTLTVNAPSYVSETAGEITETKPTTTDAVVRCVGFALTANELYFNPSSDYITHA